MNAETNECRHECDCHEQNEDDEDETPNENCEDCYGKGWYRWWTFDECETYENDCDDCKQYKVCACFDDWPPTSVCEDCYAKRHASWGCKAWEVKP